MPDFLVDLDLRPVQFEKDHGLTPIGLALGAGGQALEIIVASSERQPAADQLRNAWRERHGGRAAPVLLAVLHGEHCTMIGPSGEAPQSYPGLDVARAERLCRLALSEPNRHAALRLLQTSLPEMESELPGLQNQGFLATHELQHGVPRRTDWATAEERARPLIRESGEALLRGLGYAVEATPASVSILTADGTRTALAVYLNEDENFEQPSGRFSDRSPIAFALHYAGRERLPFVIAIKNGFLRLYPAEPGVGIGNRGQTETFVQLHLDLLSDDTLPYLWLLFASEALRDGGTLHQILESSEDFAAGLSSRLRERIYVDVVPRLAMGIASQMNLDAPTANDLSHIYQLTMTLLFRLLFIAYAEDQDLLPYRSNQLYQNRSLKTKAHELQSLQEQEHDFPFGDDSGLWDEIWAVFTAIDRGRPEWGIPAYNGGLFTDQRSANGLPSLAEIKLPGNAFGPALTKLLLDESPEGVGPVDFRSLGVREFGTIYEGLLESELSVADTALRVDEDGQYIPTSTPETADVQAGEIYLHNSSGSRKATGTYYTKTFAVEHLLRHALEPALQDHLERLDALDENAAGAAFFDFRVADIAMGSGHFLVAAIDRIEDAFSSYLTRRNLPLVTAELVRLQTTAETAMQAVSGTFEVDDNQLLRRQIARHCIFGVDINPIAVELAKLSIWIHTFVPGLPLSLLDYNLQEGNSLVGIATFDEARDLITVPNDSKGQFDLFSITAEELLGDARQMLERFSRISDASTAEIEEAKNAYREAMVALSPTEALFDILAASRLTEEIKIDIAQGAVTQWVKKMPELSGFEVFKKAQETFGNIKPFHFPLIFPQVFLRPRQGFDVILGNPPWEEATLEEDRFWLRYIPGLQGMAAHQQREQQEAIREERPDLVERFEREVEQVEVVRRTLTTGPYPGMGTGDPDLYKGFVWRFWHLITSTGGRVGVVLPRSAFAAKGSAEFRKSIFTSGQFRDITFLLNSGGWVFDDAEHRYTIGLVSIEKSPPPGDAQLPLHGPFRNMERFQDGVNDEPVRFLISDVLSWTDTGALPLLPTEESAAVFAQLRRTPRLDLDEPGQWRARPYAELHATNDREFNGRELMIFSEDRPKGTLPIFKGESFDIWQPDTGEYYAWADPELATERLQIKRERGYRNARSAFSEFTEDHIFDEETLPHKHARVAFRDVSRATDSRTTRAALLPPDVFVQNTAPILLWPRGDQKDEAFLLGVLCSIPLDWYSRRFVEIHLNFHVFNPFPIPRPDRQNLLWQRVVALAGRMAAADERFTAWANQVGVEYGPLPEETRKDMIHELDAVVAHLYELSAEQLTHIFETFHEGWEYQARLTVTLNHYNRWQT
ncbi:MAG: hypothetical protein DWQ07_18760 [Chloroflexi bacterium]|nr:MAG: hypothetical protein DWQ07_18760 [Chloroflexota bacterium]MBL1194974.1 hypothetical protein [Chloroflexota bacterium]